MLLALQSLALLPVIRYWDGFASQPEELQLPDPWTGDPLPLPDTLYKKSERSLRVFGDCPYVAAIPATLTVPLARTGQLITSMVLAVHELPQQAESADEVHQVVSFHESRPGGVELWSLGITPSGRFALSTKLFGTIMTPIGVVKADGQPHTYSAVNLGGETDSYWLVVDNVKVVAVGGAVWQDYPNSDDYPESVRVMLLNGKDGRTRCNMTLVEVTHMDEDQPIAYLLREGQGTSIYPYLHHGDPAPNGTWIRQDEWTDGDPWYEMPTLTLARFDPQLTGDPLLWGPVPASSPHACYRWGKSTSYRKRNPIAVDYTPRESPVP